jgi:hypothetical protein
MIVVKHVEEKSQTDGTEILKQIQEAAYFCFLDRIHYAQAGNQLCDWVEAENKVREKLTLGQEKLIDLNLAACPIVPE